MNVKSLIAMVVETIIKVVVLAFALMFIFRGITKAYEFGYKVFADEPVSIGNGKTITVAVAEGASTEDVANMLEEKGLINDAKLFMVQELLSAYHDKIQPGMYDLSTSMTAGEMLQIMGNGESQEPKEEIMTPSGEGEEVLDEFIEEAPSEENILDENIEEGMSE